MDKDNSLISELTRALASVCERKDREQAERLLKKLQKYQPYVEMEDFWNDGE